MLLFLESRKVYTDPVLSPPHTTFLDVITLQACADFCEDTDM